MGSLQEMERLLRIKDEQIVALQKLLEEKEDSIMQLRSKLDKFQSVLPQTQNTFIQGGPRKVRAQGISAEPLRNMSDSKTALRRHSKSGGWVTKLLMHVIVSVVNVLLELTTLSEPWSV